MSCPVVLALAKRSTKRFFLSLFFSSSVLASSHAAQQNYSFLQEGYSEGATVSGVFSADDLNGNGLIESESGEVVTLTVDWSGNSIVSPFTLSYPETTAGFDFLWDTADPIMGGGAGGFFDFAVPPAQYRWRPPEADYSRVLRPRDGPDFSTAPLVISVVPEPSTFTLLGLGSLALMIRRRLKQGLPYPCFRSSGEYCRASYLPSTPLRGARRSVEATYENSRQT